MGREGDVRGTGSQLGVFFSLLLSCWDQERKPWQGHGLHDKECVLWQQPQNLGGHRGAQAPFTETLVTWGGTEGEHDDGTCWLLRFW